MWLETTSRTEKRRTIVLAMTCLAFVFFAAPYRPGVVLGESMSPTFHSGQVFLTSRLADSDSLCRGDVVLVSVNGQLLLKRIHALGGQRVWALESEESPGTLDRVLSPSELPFVREAVSRHSALGALMEVTVPDGYVFLLGDARQNSLDSRHFGPVPVAGVRARVVVSDLFSLWGQHGGPGAQVALAQERSHQADR